MRSKRGQIWETLVPWIIGIATLILVIIIYIILAGKGQSAVDFLKSVLRFGR